MKTKMLRTRKVLSLKADALQGNKMVGDASGLGNLDSYYDVIFPDGFDGDGVIEDFLSTGFIADCHDWSKVVGMPLLAERRGNLMYTEFEFHSTQDAQDLKTKCDERIARNLMVGLSVGIGFYAEDTKTFANGAALLKFAEEQGQDLSLFDVEGIKAHTGKCRAILKISKWYEYSPIVTATPANPKAWATSIKNALTSGSDDDDTDSEGTDMNLVTKGEYLGDYVLGSMTMGAINRANDALMYGVFYDAIYYSEDPLADRRAKIAGGLNEYAGLVLRVFDAIMAEDPEDDTETAEDALKAIKAMWGDPKLSTGELPAGSFERQLKSALAAATSCQERAQSLLDLRKQDGRSLSKERREQLAAHETQLKSLLDTLVTLQKQDEPTAPTEPEVTEDTPSSDTEAVKAQRATLALKQLQRKNRERTVYTAAGGE